MSKALLHPAPKIRQSLLRGAYGFTLVELLVSSAVLSIVVAVMLGTLLTSMSLWRNTDNKIVSDREARAVQLVLARDLANVVMPPNPKLWPRILGQRAGRTTTYYLRFLTSAPDGLQGGAGNDGDVCFVEYAVLPPTNAAGGLELRRFLLESRRTFDEILTPGRFPATARDATNYQSLGLYLLPTNNMAARGLSLAAEANPTNFVVLKPDGLPFPIPANTYDTTNYPAALEVNFAVTDPDMLSNPDLLNNPNIILRNAGLYSFRVLLPRPVNTSSQ